MSYEKALRKAAYLSCREAPDETPEHHTDAKFHGELEFRVHLSQFATIPDIWRDLDTDFLESCHCNIPAIYSGNA